MKQRQQSTTSYPITFLMVDSADHVTGKTGLSPTVTISKNGGAFGSPSGAVSEIGNGWYALAGNATDRDTLGDLLIHATGAGADPVDDRYCIVPWNPFDAVRLGLTAVPNVTAGASGGLPVLDANLAASANVTLWKNTAVANADASGNAPTFLADAAHGGASATIALKSVTVTNNDMGGEAVTLTANMSTGTALLLSGWAGIYADGGVGGDIVGNLTGTVDEIGALNNSAQQNVADALKLAPTAGDPDAGSVNKHLDDILTYAAANEPADIWSYVTRTLTQSSTSTTDSTAAGSISRRRGDSWSISLTLGAITGYTSLWFTIKAETSDADTAAIVQIKKNASGLTDGLLYVNGAAASDATKGSITVSDESTGAIIVALDETITDDLAPASYSYDCQALISGSVSTPDSGTFTIAADVTRAVA